MGEIVHNLRVRRDVEQIFAYREKVSRDPFR